MEQEQMRRTFTEAPTFARIGDDVFHPALLESEITGDDDHQPMNDHFEFSRISDEFEPGAPTKITDSKILTNGLVLPVYPIFNQNIVMDSFNSSPEQELIESFGRMALPFEKHDLRSGSASSSSSTSLDVEDQATYRWSPQSTLQSSNRWFMSQSMAATSSEFRRFRIRDLFVSRSRSEKKEMERGGFFTVSCLKPMKEAGKKATKVKGEGKGKGMGKSGEVKGMDVVTAHRIFYGKGINVSRRSFQPYQPCLIGGFFGHGKHLAL